MGFQYLSAAYKPMRNIFSSIFTSGESRPVAKLRQVVERINLLEDEVQKIPLEAFPEKTEELKARLREGESLDELLPLAFAYAREVALRTLGKRHFDVQLMGGVALHQGNVVEMRTGEGKTLSATAPLYLNALTGKGAHLVTVNDYLAKRDAVWMGEIYTALGLTVGAISDNEAFLYTPLKKKELDQRRDMLGAFKVEHEFLTPAGRKAAYQCDILYGTNHAFGFDYLRDNLMYSSVEQVGRTFNYAIIDEVDSILIDEARTPLIISAPQEDASRLYVRFATLVGELKNRIDYSLDEKRRAVSLTQAGLKHVERILGRDLYGQSEIELIFHLDQALKAHTVFARDRDYVVREGKVIIVDEFTGRLMPDRRFSEGLHQALEAKEGVPIQAESKTVATVTIQNFFKKYEKLGGMTGTALTSAEEFDKVYEMEAIAIPPHRTMIREDLSDRIYKTANAKWRALVKEIRERQATGQPVLVGTVSVEKNEFLSKLLKKAGVSHVVLNAKYHEKEGEVIAQAGQKGRVTVATNMAGRGVDIVLGGNPFDEAKADEVRSHGGLFVLGTDRHEARRIDNQLRGRSGRQGDPGQTQFFTSLEDDLMRVFGGDRIKSLMTRFNFPEDMPIENRMISSSIERAQSQVEGYNFDIRKRLQEYDDVINKQRDNIYQRRQRIVKGYETNPEFVKEQVLEIIEAELNLLVDAHVVDDVADLLLKEIGEAFQAITNAPLPHGEYVSREEVKEAVTKHSIALYEERERLMGADTMRALEKELLLRSIDMSWSDYLVSLDHLRQTVGLRAVGGHDPLVEFKREARRTFEDLLADINQKVVEIIFKVQAEQTQMRPVVSIVSNNFPAPLRKNPPKLVEKKGEDIVRQDRPAESPKIGRNDPCYCGSGKKFKKCHGA